MTVDELAYPVLVLDFDNNWTWLISSREQFLRVRPSFAPCAAGDVVVDANAVSFVIADPVRIGLSGGLLDRIRQFLGRFRIANFELTPTGQLTWSEVQGRVLERMERDVEAAELDVSELELPPEERLRRRYEQIAPDVREASTMQALGAFLLDRPSPPDGWLTQHGRSTRAEYWAVASLFLAWNGGVILAGMSIGSLGHMVLISSILKGASLLIWLLLMCAAMRRLQDLGYVRHLFWLIPVTCLGVFMGAEAFGLPGPIPGGLGFGLLALETVALGLAPSMPGLNAFGPSWSRP